MFRRTTATIVVLLLVALAGGCGGDSPFGATTTAPASLTSADASTTAPTALTSTVPTTTVAPTTTAAPATTAAPTTTVPPFACPGMGVGGIPAGATDISSVSAYLDGDSLLDEFTGYQNGGIWYLHVRLGPGYTANLALDAAWDAAHWGLGANYVNVAAAKTLGDPRQVVVVQVYGGLVAAYGLFAVENCQIVTLADAGGAMPDLYVLGSPAHSDFPVCGPGNTVVQAIFGANPPCSDIWTCTTPDLSGEEYRVLRDPGRIQHVGSISRASTDAEMANMQANSCPNP